MVLILDSGYFAANGILLWEGYFPSDICDWSILMTYLTCDFCTLALSVHDPVHAHNNLLSSVYRLCLSALPVGTPTHNYGISR